MRLKVDLLPRGSYPDVVVLVDVLRGTTNAPILLEAGAKHVYLTPSLKTARQYAQDHNLLLVGERDGMPLEGSNYPASPAELRNRTLDRDVMYMAQSTPQALRNLSEAKHVLLGSFYNARAVVKKAVELAAEEIAIVCTGQDGNETLEDTVCAGFLARRIEKLREVQLLDAARMAMALVRAFPDVQEALLQSSTGQQLQKLRLYEDIAVSSLISQTDRVPKLLDVKLSEDTPVYRFK
ncbi:2-phosphosulfolactate phosphatase [Deinococcus roseus]|uniref:Probable 2-phosphosulfolactate phosphatase n=1 Tax=Deinococcus roseus TaxID=392414 RepID=A0ABQ2D047_9DEIO|nr:2-phosphosulfolactate phosphatase [Deinococcus roseus]GGJ33197.1 putative 2-phosphosulfolactate phosphatase [Deinococcus roseus]